MEFFKTLAKAMVIGVGGLWLLMAFFEWDEGEMDNGFTQILPYDLYYVYEGVDEGPENATSWFVTATYNEHYSNEQKTCEMQVSRIKYNHLKEGTANSANNEIRYAPIWNYRSKITSVLQCKLNLKENVSINDYQYPSTEIDGFNRNNFKDLYEE